MGTKYTHFRKSGKFFFSLIQGLNASTIIEQIHFWSIYFLSAVKHNFYLNDLSPVTRYIGESLWKGVGSVVWRHCGQLHEEVSINHCRLAEFVSVRSLGQYCPLKKNAVNPVATVGFFVSFPWRLLWYYDLLG